MQVSDHGGDVYGNSGVRLDFSVNTNPLGMPQEVQRAVIDGMADYTRYPDPACRALTAALSAQHGVLPEQILCGNGASDLILRTCLCLRPKRVLTLAPTFSEYTRNVALCGGEMREYPLTESSGYVLDDGFLSYLTPDIELVFLCNPNNPTGRLCSPALLMQILKRCKANGTRLLIDECFLDFTEGRSMLSYLPQYPNLLILKAFTKLYAMAGLRLGYLICADTALLSSVGAYGATWSVSGVAQKAGIAALNCRDLVVRTQTLVKAERAVLTNALTNLGYTVYPSDANFLLVKGNRPVYDALLDKGILVRDCRNFSGLDERYFRIGVKLHEQNEALLYALSEV